MKKILVLAFLLGATVYLSGCCPLSCLIAGKKSTAPADSSKAKNSSGTVDNSGANPQ